MRKNKAEKVIIDIPTKNRIAMGLMYLKLPLFLPFVKDYLCKQLIHCENVTFIPGFNYFFGNIYAKNVFLCDTKILDYGEVHIGEGTNFSFDCMIITSHHSRDDFDKIVVRPVKIGKNVYVGARSIILSGVEIGDNTVIGAGSVVSSDIPSNCLAAGNPCKVVKYFK